MTNTARCAANPSSAAAVSEAAVAMVANANASPTFFMGGPLVNMGVVFPSHRLSPTARYTRSARNLPPVVVGRATGRIRLRVAITE